MLNQIIAMILFQARWLWDWKKSWVNSLDIHLTLCPVRVTPHLISPYSVTPRSNINVMRIKKNDQQVMKLLIIKQILLTVLGKCIQNTLENMHLDVRVFRVKKIWPIYTTKYKSKWVQWDYFRLCDRMRDLPRSIRSQSWHQWCQMIASP